MVVVSVRVASRSAMNDSRPAIQKRCVSLPTPPPISAPRAGNPGARSRRRRSRDCFGLAQRVSTTPSKLGQRHVRAGAALRARGRARRSREGPADQRTEAPTLGVGACRGLRDAGHACRCADATVGYSAPVATPMRAVDAASCARLRACRAAPEQRGAVADRNRWLMCGGRRTRARPAASRTARARAAARAGTARSAARLVARDVRRQRVDLGLAARHVGRVAAAGVAQAPRQRRRAVSASRAIAARSPVPRRPNSCSTYARTTSATT